MAEGVESTTAGNDSPDELSAVIAALENKRGHEVLVPRLMEIKRSEPKKRALDSAFNAVDVFWRNFTFLGQGQVEKVVRLLSEFSQADSGTPEEAAKAQEVAKELNS